MKDTNDVKDIEPGLTIRAIGTTQPDGSFLWGGVMFGPSGQEFGAVTGRLPREIIQTREARRRGRPKDEKKKVSLSLHEWMALQLANAVGGTKISARLSVARALNIGGADDKDAADYVRKQAAHADVRKALEGFDRMLTFAGDSDGTGRLAILLRSDAIVKNNGSSVKVSGYAWVCQWGDRGAKYGKIDLLIPVNSQASDMAV